MECPLPNPPQRVIKTQECLPVNPWCLLIRGTYAKLAPSGGEDNLPQCPSLKSIASSWRHWHTHTQIRWSMKKRWNTREKQREKKETKNTACQIQTSTLQQVSWELFWDFFSPTVVFFFFFFCKSELWLGWNVIWNVTGGPRFAVSLLLPIKGEKERGYIIAIINRANMIFALFGGRQYFSNPTRREGLEMWVISTGLFFFLG